MIETIKQLCESFIEDAQKGEKGNKSAAARARKTSLELAAKFKEFRKESLTWNK